MKRVAASLVGCVLLFFGISLLFLGVSAERYTRAFRDVNSNSPFYLAEKDLAAVDNLDSFEYRFVKDTVLQEYQRALILARDNKFEEAEGLFQTVIDANGGGSEKLVRNSHYNLGTLFFLEALDNNENPDAFKTNILLAKLHLEEALRIDPNYIDAKHNLEKLYQFLNAIESTIPTEEKGKERYSPGRPVRDF